MYGMTKRHKAVTFFPSGYVLYFIIPLAFALDSSMFCCCYWLPNQKLEIGLEKVLVNDSHYNAPVL